MRLGATIFVGKLSESQLSVHCMIRTSLTLSLWSTQVLTEGDIVIIPTSQMKETEAECWSHLAKLMEHKSTIDEVQYPPGTLSWCFSRSPLVKTGLFFFTAPRCLLCQPGLGTTRPHSEHIHFALSKQSLQTLHVYLGATPRPVRKYPSAGGRRNSTENWKMLRLKVRFS